MDLDHHSFPRSAFSRTKSVSQSIVLDTLADFGNAVAWSADFEEDFPLDVGWGGGHEQRRIFQVAGCAPGEVGLVLFTLGVCEVGPFVRVQRKTKTTFQRTKVIAEDIWILFE